MWHMLITIWILTFKSRKLFLAPKYSSWKLQLKLCTKYFSLKLWDCRDHEIVWKKWQQWWKTCWLSGTNWNPQIEQKVQHFTGVWDNYITSHIKGRGAPLCCISLIRNGNCSLQRSRSRWPRSLRCSLWLLGRWDCGFESCLRHGCLALFFCVLLSCVGRGLCDRLITCPK
jgi:hypothetical protein